MFEIFCRDVRQLWCENLRSAQRLVNAQRMLFNFNVAEFMIANQSLSDYNRVFIVVAVPGKERYKQVPSKSELALVDAGAVGDNLSGFDFVTDLNDRTLVQNRVLVGAVIADQRIPTRFAGSLSQGYFSSGYLSYSAGATGDYGVSGRTRDDFLHAGTNAWSFRLDERQGLA